MEYKIRQENTFKNVEFPDGSQYSYFDDDKVWEAIVGDIRDTIDNHIVEGDVITIKVDSYGHEAINESIRKNH